MERRQHILIVITLFVFALGVRLYDLDNAATQDDEQLWLARSYALVHSVFNSEPDINEITRIYSDNGNVDVFETGENILPEQYPFTIRTEAHHPGVPPTLLMGLSYVFLADGSHPASLDLLSTVAAVKLPQVIIGSLLVVVTYLGTGYMFNRRVALVAAILILVSPLLIGFSRLARIDMTSAFFATCMMFSYVVRVQQTSVRKNLQWAILTGVFAGLGMATNPYAVYCVPVFAVVKILLTPSGNLKRYQRFLPDVYDVLFLLVWIGVYILGHPNLWANPVAGFEQWLDITVTQRRHLRGEGDHLLYSYYVLVTTLPSTLLLAFIGLLGSWTRYKRQVTVIVVWFAFFLLLLSIPSGKKNIKNILLLSVPIAMLAGLGVDWLSAWFAKRFSRLSEKNIFRLLVGLQVIIGLAVTWVWLPLPHLYLSPGVTFDNDEAMREFVTTNGIKPALDYAYAHSLMPPKLFLAPGARNNLMFHLPEDQYHFATDDKLEEADWLFIVSKALNIDGAWYNDVEPTHVLTHHQLELGHLYYLPDFFPRELVDTSSPIVRYDNGIEIYKVSHEVSGGQLSLTTWWGQKPGEHHGFSLQIFDAEMNKVAQGDFLLPVEYKQVSELDVSDIPAGDYRMLLITYDLATATSLNGIDLVTDQPFERAYDAGILTIPDDSSAEADD